MTSVLTEPLRAFAQHLTKNFSVATFSPAQTEDQLKSPVQAVIQTAGAAFGLDVVTRTEAQMTDLGVRPDIGITVNKLPTAHIELKAPGKGADPKKFKDEHDKQQWEKFQHHPNLVYTDGRQWSHWRLGERVGPIVTLAGDPTADGEDAVTDANAVALEGMLRSLLQWEPIVPKSPKALAEVLAPLCRLLREDALVAVQTGGSALDQLSDEWRQYLFPEADDAQFADAYAQTVTYALLLARFEGETDLHSKAAERLDARHGLLAQVLRILADPQARKEVEIPVDLLERSISAVDPTALLRRSRGGDPWLYFYEDFLAAYDPKLRKNRGVYFTPAEVVHAQVALIARLLEERFGKSLTFADDDVVVLDPATGTGTYLLAAMKEGLDKVEDEYGAGAVANRATSAARAFNGFELLIGPYSVAHLRFAQRIQEAGGALPEDGVHVYLTDTLDNPYTMPSGQQKLTLTHKRLGEENERARKVKSDVRVLVCLGNPPYYRQNIASDEKDTVEPQGGWVRKGDHGHDGILNDFLKDVPGVHAKNLYNLYVYFWRWALWKVLDSTGGPGIVSFITASSYLRGPGFVGMRQYMREVFDEMWILDLEGDSRGPRKTENVFDIQTAVAIAIGVRYGPPNPRTPAQVHYARIEGNREEKLGRLQALSHFDGLEWQRCFEGWMNPLLPETAGDFYNWPLLTDLFPWQHSGVQYKRTWPIAPEQETLRARWETLLGAPAAKQGDLMRSTAARLPSGQYADTRHNGSLLGAIATLPPGSPPLPPVQYGYRSLDRQWALPDNRLCDRPRPPLWLAYGERQVHLTSMLTTVLGDGPAATVTALIPDLHHFRGSYGGADVMPLWRDAGATQANITNGLLERLSTKYGAEVSPESFFAYCYSVLAAPEYVVWFSEELLIPGPRLPVTKSPALFEIGVSLGRRLVWLHTFGDRFTPAGHKKGTVPQGAARCVVSVPSAPSEYPVSHKYDAAKRELHVGSGVFAPVSPQVRTFNVSGLDVVGSWLDYRMKHGAGKKSSPLDDIRPESWSASFTEELLRLLWVLEATTDMSPALNDNLTAIVSGEMFGAEELPTPSPGEREAPKPAQQSTLGLA